MRIKFCLNLLIVWVGLAQVIAVTSGDNKGASSTLLLRQKRSSGEVINPSPPHEFSGYRTPEPIRGPAVGSYYPGYWEGKVPVGMVRVYHRETELGLGIVIKGNMIVTKAHFFSTPIAAGEYHVLAPEPDGRMIRRNILSKMNHEPFERHHDGPWGTYDICFAITDGRMAKAFNKTELISQSRLFTADQVDYLSIREYPYLLLGA